MDETEVDQPTVQSLVRMHGCAAIHVYQVVNYFTIIFNQHYIVFTSYIIYNQPETVLLRNFIFVNPAEGCF